MKVKRRVVFRGRVACQKRSGVYCVAVHAWETTKVAAAERASNEVDPSKHAGAIERLREAVRAVISSGSGSQTSDSSPPSGRKVAVPGAQRASCSLGTKLGAT